MTSFFQEAPVSESRVPIPVMIELPEPMFIPRPVPLAKPQQRPKTARREYSAGELAAAALMMDKLRSREDLLHLVRQEELPIRYDLDHVLDAVTHRLMMVLSCSAGVPPVPALPGASETPALRIAT